MKIHKSEAFEGFYTLLEQTYAEVLKETMDTAQRARESEGANQSRYDTHKVEGSWLANSLSKRVRSLEQQLMAAKRVPREDGLSPARIGSLITYRLGDTEGGIYLLPFSQGETIDYDGVQILSLSPVSPLGQLFVGVEPDDTVTFRDRKYGVSDVY